MEKVRYLEKLQVEVAGAGEGNWKQGKVRFKSTLERQRRQT